MERKTNEDLMSQMMNFSKVGALGQGLIMEAVRRYAKELSEITEDDIAKNQRSIVSYEALRIWGVETLERMDHFYKTNQIK